MAGTDRGVLVSLRTLFCYFDLWAASLSLLG
jgi:hypothetical protein